MANFKELVRIGKDAEIRVTQGGKPVMGFSAAFDNGWGDRKQTVWLDCSAWGDRWERVCPYITKGSQIVVEGSIGTREYNDKTYITLDVSDIKLTGKPQDGQQRQPERQQPAHTQHSAPQQQPEPADAWDDPDSIPF